MKQESLVLKEKYLLFCNVFGMDDEKTLLSELNYIESIIPETDDIGFLFERVVENIKSCERIKVSINKGVDVLDKLVFQIFEKLSDDPRVFGWYKTASQYGLDNANSGIGYCYLNGIGVEEDEDRAVEILEPLVEKGNTLAEYSLGRGRSLFDDKLILSAANKGLAIAQKEYADRLLIQGGIEKDNGASIESVKWYSLAAEQGLAVAQYILGDIYQEGRIIERDYSKAVEWFRKAAVQGYSHSQRKMGNINYNGIIIDQNYQEAVMWYGTAFAHKDLDYDDAEDLFNYGNCFYLGLGVVQDYGQALKWFRKAANEGSSEAKNAIGDCYYNGTGLDQDIEEAVKWYKEAAEEGSVTALTNIGECYCDGKGVPKDAVEGVRWYLKAAEQGDGRAQNFVGVHYARGDGIEKNEETAFEWYKKSAATGYSWGQYNLGQSYYYGSGVKADTDKAIENYEKAAEQGLAVAQYKLGYIYTPRCTGFGHRNNTQASLYWLIKSALQKNYDAQEELDSILDLAIDDDRWDIGCDINEVIEKLSVLELSSNEIEIVIKICPYINYEKQLLMAYRIRIMGLSADVNTKALTQLGEIYRSIVNKNEEKNEASSMAFDCYKTAADRGDPDAQLILGKCYKGAYSYGGIAPLDLDESVAWFEKSADKGNDYAKLELAELYTTELTGLSLWSPIHTTHYWKYWNEEEGIKILLQLFEKYKGKKKGGRYPDAYGCAILAVDWLDNIRGSKGKMWSLMHGATKWPRHITGKGIVD